ncbi:MAG: Phosphoribosylaminoimidazole carboxylase catalytic subunit [Brockia lithotrophica]|uniref:N5-carboxyaminoimidazole ribonucleotide mutase n=1 Tax=Brockia lithotrophica TaxID=933949 RepID=A0A2T5GAP8_9BACL|nr:MAG: Phosphoribosylaminoimidazole carboxylase catalytic subunit [Brockia lithotrophica]
MARVLVILGSASDRERVRPLLDVLARFGEPSDIRIASAHRNLEDVLAIVREAEQSGVRVVIAAAGLAAHLPGVVAGQTVLPVIGLPLAVGPLHGVDALLSIAQMPPGVPVATVGVNAGENAAYLALHILALEDPELAARLRSHRAARRDEIRALDRNLRREVEAEPPGEG